MLGRWCTASGRSRCSTFCTRTSRKRTGVQFSQKTQEILHSFLLRKCFVLFHSVWLQMEKHLSLKHGSPPFFLFLVWCTPATDEQQMTFLNWFETECYLVLGRLSEQILLREVQWFRGRLSVFPFYISSGEVFKWVKSVQALAKRR